eukprot:scaffold9384_cov70-Skeletonema_dohrnii-CCMP3373.AAC.1
MSVSMRERLVEGSRLSSSHLPLPTNAVKVVVIIIISNNIAINSSFAWRLTRFRLPTTTANDVAVVDSLALRLTRLQTFIIVIIGGGEHYSTHHPPTTTTTADDDDEYSSSTTAATTIITSLCQLRLTAHLIGGVEVAAAAMVEDEE